jgi:Domain of unknown function (DUF1707)
VARGVFWSAPNAHLRCSDAERERVAEFLRDRAAEGRLTPDELADRVALAYRAVTMGDLDRLVDDLPGSPFSVARPAQPRRRLGPRVVVLALLALLVALPGSLWAVWLGGFALAMVLGIVVLALTLTLGPFLLVAAVAAHALRRVGRGPAPPPWLRR